MRILIINHYAGSVEHGMEYRPYYLAREWVKAGHEIVILAASFSHLRTQQPRVKNLVSTQMIDNIEYVWLKTPAYQGNSLMRVINMLVFISQLLLRLALFRNKWLPDVVIASSTYPLDIIPGYRIAKKNGAKLVYEVHDLWPLTPIELGKIPRSHPYIMMLQWAEDFAYQKADVVVSMLANARDYMIEHGMEPGKYEYVPNGINVEEWNGNPGKIPDEHQDALSSIKQDGHLIVGYAGGHGLSNALEFLIKAAYLLKDQPIAFVFVGQGPEKDDLKRLAVEQGLSKVIFLPPVPKKAIPNLLQAMDVLYLGWRKEPIYQYGISPNKLLDYMMAAKPVIHAVDAGNDWVADSDCGISVPPEDSEAIAEGILKLMAMSQNDRRAMGCRGKEFVLTHHDYRILARHFSEVIS